MSWSPEIGLPSFSRYVPVCESWFSVLRAGSFLPELRTSLSRLLTKHFRVFYLSVRSLYISVLFGLQLFGHLISTLLSDKKFWCLPWCHHPTRQWNMMVPYGSCIHIKTQKTMSLRPVTAIATGSGVDKQLLTWCYCAFYMYSIMYSYRVFAWKGIGLLWLQVGVRKKSKSHRIRHVKQIRWVSETAVLCKWRSSKVKVAHTNAAEEQKSQAKRPGYPHASINKHGEKSWTWTFQQVNETAYRILPRHMRPTMCSFCGSNLPARADSNPSGTEPFAVDTVIQWLT